MKKNTNKIGKVKPNPLAWFIYVTGSKIYMSKRNKVIIDRTVFKNRNKKEGCIVLYNHSSNKDHFVTTLSFGFTRVAYVTTSHFYYSKKLSFVLKLARAIPKEQFKSDVSTIKKIKRALNKKVPVAIAPTGQITVHGDALYFDPSIVKLLKMCKVDVYAIRMHGNYYAYPKWRKYYRDVPIHSEFVKVIDKRNNLSSAVRVNVNGEGNITTPKIVGGSRYFVALKGNGTVWSWGLNGNGQLGVGDTTNRTEPTEVKAEIEEDGEVKEEEITDAVDIAVGYYHTLILRKDGTVWSAGYNHRGQLGDGTTTSTTLFHKVKGENGDTYLVTTDENGYTITNQKDNTTIGFVFDSNDNSWSVSANGETTKFMTFVDDNHVKMPGVDGNDMIIELSQAGVMAYQEAAQHFNFAMK